MKKIIVFETILPGLNDEFSLKETKVGLATIWNNIQDKVKK